MGGVEAATTLAAKKAGSQFDPAMTSLLCANGEQILLARSGGPTVAAVLRLEDGTIRAVLVGCGIGIDPDACAVIDPPADSR